MSAVTIIGESAVTGITTHTRTPLLMWSLAAAPAVWLLLFGAFVLRARLALGRWPVPYEPDPTALGFTVHHTALLAGLPLMWAAVATVIGLAVAGRHRGERPWLPPVVAVCGLGVLVLLAYLDPGRLFVWLGD